MNISRSNGFGKLADRFSANMVKSAMQRCTLNIYGNVGVFGNNYNWETEKTSIIIPRSKIDGIDDDKFLNNNEIFSLLQSIEKICVDEIKRHYPWRLSY